MFDREEMIKSALEAVIDNTDLEPGELNQNINRVMVSMQKANEQFDDLDDKIQVLLTATEDLNESGTQMAEASVQIARASEKIGKSVNELNETQQEMSNNIEELQDTLNRLENYMPEDEQ